MAKSFDDLLKKFDELNKKIERLGGTKFGDKTFKGFKDNIKDAEKFLRMMTKEAEALENTLGNISDEFRASVRELEGQLNVSKDIRKVFNSLDSVSRRLNEHKREESILTVKQLKDMKRKIELETQELKQETAQIEEISPEDAQLIIADCLRDNGYDVQDPTPNKSLRDQIRPENEKERQEVFEIISLCAEENNLPIFSENSFEDPEVVAELLDIQLEIAQCLREQKDIEITDPTAEVGLRELIAPLVMSGIYDAQEIRLAVDSCFDELGIERPDGPGGGPRG